MSWRDGKVTAAELRDVLAEQRAELEWAGENASGFIS